MIASLVVARAKSVCVCAHVCAVTCVRSRVCGHVCACTQSLGPKAEDTLVLCVKDRWAEDLCPRGGPRSQQLL